jgi:hypothetical protein
MTTADQPGRLSPLIGWFICWLGAMILTGIIYAEPFDCGSWQQRVAPVLLVLLTTVALALSVWAMSFHKWWFLVIPLVVLSLFGLGFAVVVLHAIWTVGPCFSMV